MGFYHAYKTDINYVEWIHEGAQLYIGIRISAEYNQANLAKFQVVHTFAKLAWLYSALILMPI